MDIFSLISLKNLQHPQYQDAAGKVTNENTSNDRFEPNRNSEELSSSNLISTHQHWHISILPKSPPKTPPRPTSRVDDRIRVRRCTSSGTSFSSARDDDYDSFVISHVNSPNTSPNTSDLSMSPLQQRLAQARDKRQMILKERVKHIDYKSKEREKLASKRREDATVEKVIKARRVLAKSPIAKDRRDQQMTLRVQSVEAMLESKTALAQSRLERHLFEKQRRACCKERVERADRRRILISYEKRAKLLATLDAKHERAALISHRFNEDKASKAGEDIIRAKMVARRVRACRKIQGLVREAYGLEVPNRAHGLSQYVAAQRIIKFVRAHACKKRLLAKNTIYALGKLLELFPLATQRKGHPLHLPPFEHLTQVMMQPETLKLATLIVDCFHPFNFGVTAEDRKCSRMMDGRTLLALFLIAVHPHEVLGSDFDVKDDRVSRGSRLLSSSCRKMLLEFQTLDNAVRIHKHMLKAQALFFFWKSSDMEMLLANLSMQLEQSWVVYLTSCETLKYLVEVTNGIVQGPHMSLKIRHENGRAGSRAHIKRIRISLNKLLGEETGKEVVTNAKLVASKNIEESHILEELKGEIDEIHGGLGTVLDSRVVTLAQSEPEQPMVVVDNPQEISSNVNDLSEGMARFEAIIKQSDKTLDRRRLVHNILLTDASDFHTLSWDGANNQQPDKSPEEFMVSFSPQDSTAISTEIVSVQIALSMRLAFFHQVAHHMDQGSFESAIELLKELHSMMRSLIPSRNELHIHMNDGEIFTCSTTSDIVRVLIRSGYLLANCLESAARAVTTKELIECLEEFNSRCSDGSNNRPLIPYGIVTENMFVVASIAYILHKAELCQADIHNYKLSQVAPIIHAVGHDYERKQLQNTHGDYSSCTIEELQKMLPSTWNWVKNMQSCNHGGSWSNQSCLDQKLDVLRSKGFVDGLLFARIQVTLPELFSLDLERISRIRSEARCCVIASALALHACNISRCRSSALSSADMSDARRRLSSVLRKTHFDQNEFERSVIDAVSALAKASAERDLAEDEIEALTNHTLAVLRGNDPVLKLLDNRVQGFFRFACRWKPDTDPSDGNAVPPEMRTGRPALAAEDYGSMHGIKSTKEKFLMAAKKEASRLGFFDSSSDFIDAGYEARAIVNLACVNYSQDVLVRFLDDAASSHMHMSA
ncbi:hypothetical protein ACHAXA_006693 [Cyclostephanos tholiformis]|uniref:T-complex protein 11 n=1 Tax=Cyclostephanos tholiformis TaxID=382380 RepID=A0ABD3RIL5_9STRA